MTPRAISLYKTYDVVVWWATPVEIASSLARMQQLNPRDWAKANNLAKKLSGLWSVIQPSNSLRATAMQLVERCGLRILFSWRPRWNGVNTLLTTESF
jgi:hypothetical protein